MKNILWRFTAFYSYGFFFLSIIAGVGGLLTIAVCFVSNENHDVILKQGLYPGIGLLIDSILWVIWAIIFKKIKNIFREGDPDKNYLRIIWKLLLGTFAVDIVGLLFGLFFSSQQIDWSAVQIPSGSESVPLQVLMWYLYCLNILRKYGEFINPTTSGLATLFIAMLVYMISDGKSTATSLK